MTQEKLIPHPKDIDLTAEARRRVFWPKVVLIGSLKRAYPRMTELYRDFGKYRVDALVPWAYLEDLREHQPDLVEKFNVEKHFLAILGSDMAYVVNPSGYVGTNSATDIGVALGAGKPVYSMEKPTDRGVALEMDGVKGPIEIALMAHVIAINRTADRIKNLNKI